MHKKLDWFKYRFFVGSEIHILPKFLCFCVFLFEVWLPEGRQNIVFFIGLLDHFQFCLFFIWWQQKYHNPICWLIHDTWNYQDEQKDGKPILLPLSQIPLPWAKIPRPEMSSNSQIFQSVQEMRCWLCGRWNYLLQAEPPTVGRTTYCRQNHGRHRFCVWKYLRPRRHLNHCLSR